MVFKSPLVQQISTQPQIYTTLILLILGYCFVSCEIAFTDLSFYTLFTRLRCLVKGKFENSGKKSI